MVSLFRVLFEKYKSTNTCVKALENNLNDLFKIFNNA